MDEAGGGFRTLTAPRDAGLMPPASWAGLRDGGQLGPSLSLSGCISLSASTGKKISLRSCEFLAQAGWEAARQVWGDKAFGMRLLQGLRSCPGGEGSEVSRGYGTTKKRLRFLSAFGLLANRDAELTDLQSTVHT